MTNREHDTRLLGELQGSSREPSHTAGVKLELEGLLARVEGAEGADRHIECALATALGFPAEWTGGEVVFAYSEDDRAPWGLVPHYTADLNAVLALVERRLPTFTTDLTIYRTNAGEFKPHSLARLFCPYGEISEYRGDARTPALALLAALLKALIQAEAAPTGQSAERQPSPRDDLIAQPQPSQTGESGEGKGEGR